MTSRREILHNIQSLGDIANIMGSMKSLSVLETKKLAHFQTTQQRVLQSFEEAATQFLAWHPLHADENPDGRAVIMLIGSERGFCSDYNDALLTTLDSYPIHDPSYEVWAIGRKLCDRISQHDHLLRIPGPSVAEEIPDTLNRLAETLSQRPTPAQLIVMHHHPDKPTVQTKSVLPPFLEHNPHKSPMGFPPVLNLKPEQFFQKLVEHYIIAILHGLFYDALLAEHRRRVQHLEGAMDRIEEKQSQLTSRSNELRQEEITEEIEIIMLATDTPT